MTVSPRLSFKGYSLLVALARNKDLVKGLVTLITGWSYMTGFDKKAFLIGIATAGISLVGKLLLDAVDYFFSEVEL